MPKFIKVKVGMRQFKSYLMASRYYKKNYHTFVSRLGRGWSIHSALQTPVRKYEKRD